ncbi:Tetratricopeptide TPR_1 repeat-containing protein [[Leptolyngbya] sp. PCC 7376]|uniref:CHAT domain-containing protein n=1 Tax=[Leptolyngbya] sp. PCC 7376 TaxID=111781 RepID=UPI00029EF1C0|nr:CHAT domain-containing protein [[Leptolyngbya] sp. PCC 7376]AFY39800.1 Tetratricopeptide TPR_1 repeat-containing protein [[Leptolyngbya] sp. PCC 7376]
MKNRSYIFGLIGGCALWGSLLSATSYSFTMPNVSPSISQRQTGEALTAAIKQAYSQERYTEANALLEQAIATARQQNNQEDIAYYLNILSLTQQQLGLWDAAEQSLSEAIAFQGQDQATFTYAQSLNNQGRLQLKKGQAETAFQTWQQAEKLYRKLDDKTGILGTRINQSQALQTLGFYRRARNILSELTPQVLQGSDPLLQIQQLRSLGLALVAIGQLEDDLSQTKATEKENQDKDIDEILSAKTAFEKSLKIAEDNQINPTTIYLHLGSIAKQQKKGNEAIAYYEKAYSEADSETIRVKALLSQLRVLVEQKKYGQIQDIQAELQTKILGLPANRSNIYALVNFADSLQRIPDYSQPQQIVELLHEAIAKAQTLNDVRAESYALGTLGVFYLKQNQLTKAQTFSQQAFELSQMLNAEDLIFRWASQLGKTYREQGDQNGDRPNDKAQNYKLSANYYDIAITALNKIRGDLIAVDTDVQFDFRERVEPIYREYVDVLLTPTAGQDQPSRQNIEAARGVIEALQVSELANFFRTACIDLEPTSINELIQNNDPHAAVVYPIILPERLAVITYLPSGRSPQTKNNSDKTKTDPQDQYIYHSTPAKQTDLEKVIQRQRRAILNPSYPNVSRLQLSQGLYQWLIQPVEPQLKEQDIQTLVFVLDGGLRNIPMAALHDGQRYLIEKYAIALTPGLQLLQPPELSSKQSQQMIIGALTEARQGFSALPAVAAEVETIRKSFTEQTLFNDSFTTKAFQSTIDEFAYPIVHLATHGQFSSDPNETFLLTWDEKISIEGLKSIVEQRSLANEVPIDLLVLSACQTAAGDDRAALGLAGLAVRSGVRTTVATLWSVNDASTAQAIAKFYENLQQPNTTKSEALRQAQLSLLSENSAFQHPYYWAPFVMVGNWF